MICQNYVHAVVHIWVHAEFVIVSEWLNVDIHWRAQVNPLSQVYVSLDVLQEGQGLVHFCVVYVKSFLLWLLDFVRFDPFFDVDWVLIW